MPKYAAVIGINYTQLPPTLSSEGARRASVNPLNYAEADAQAIAALLRQDGYEVVQLLGPEATRAAIIEALDEQAYAARNPGDLLLVYFAGHGAIDPRK